MSTIEVSQPVYEILDRETQPGESIDDMLLRLLDFDGVEEVPEPEISEVESGDVYGSNTNMWTVYDQLDRERSEGETLSETFERLQG